MPASQAIRLTAVVRPISRTLAKNWWLLLLRGLCAILFGALTFIWPVMTLLTLIVLYGVFALVDGILALTAAVTEGALAPGWWLAVVGLIGIAAGLLTFFWPGITALALLFFIAGWAIATGVMQIIGAIRLREEIDNEWLLVAGGLLSVVFGFVVLIEPGAGALAVTFAIGAHAVLYGLLLVLFSLRLRKHVA